MKNERFKMPKQSRKFAVDGKGRIVCMYLINGKYEEIVTPIESYWDDLYDDYNEIFNPYICPKCKNGEIRKYTERCPNCKVLFDWNELR